MYNLESGQLHRTVLSTHRFTGDFLSLMKCIYLKQLLCMLDPDYFLLQVRDFPARLSIRFFFWLECPLESIMCYSSSVFRILVMENQWGCGDQPGSLKLSMHSFRLALREIAGESL